MLPQLLGALQIEENLDNLGDTEITQPDPMALEREIRNKYSAGIKRCLKSLSFSEMGYREAVIERPVQNSYEWTDKHEAYRQWQYTPNRLLWIKGKPGAGKSVLMKSIVDSRDRAASGDTLILKFFFNTRGAIVEKKPVGLYSALLYGLTAHDPMRMWELLVRFIEKELQSHTGKVSWHVVELAEMFHSSVSQERGDDIEIFIDALDECVEDDVRDLIRKFEQTVGDAHLSGARIKVCWSSRYYPNISMSTQYGSVLKLDEHNHNDICEYVNRELCVGSDSELNSVREYLLSRANGVFLWAMLATKQLLKAIDQGRNPSQLRDSLRVLPQQLHDLFNQVFLALDSTKEDREELVGLVQWILCSRRPISLRELYVARQIQSREIPHKTGDLDLSQNSLKRFQKRITHVSGGLFESNNSAPSSLWPVPNFDPEFVKLHPVLTKLKPEVDPEFNPEARVQAIHESVREFFLGYRGLGILSAQSTDDFLELGMREISITCFKAFLTTDFWEICSPPDGADIIFWRSFMSEHLEKVSKSLQKGRRSRDSLLGPDSLRRHVFRYYLQNFHVFGMRHVFPVSFLYEELQELSPNSWVFGFEAGEFKELLHSLQLYSGLL